MRFAHWRKDKVPIRAENRTLKDVASSNFSSTPLPERNRGNSHRESGLFCQQLILSIHCVSLKQPSNPHLLAHGACYVPALCEIKRQTESNRGNQVDYDCPTNKLDLYGRSIGVSGLARSCDLKLNLRNLVRGTSPADAAEVHELGLKIVSFSMTPSGMDSSHGASKALRHELTTPSAQRNWKGARG